MALRPVEGAVGDLLELVGAGGVAGVRRDADRDRYGLMVRELRLGDPVVEVLDEAVGVLLVLGDQKRELVAAEAECLDLAALDEQARQLHEDLVADGVAVAVVAALELVHVDEAERHLTARLLRPLERLAQAALVRAVVAQPGEAVGERVARRDAGGERGALVEREGEERPGEEDEEPRVGRPERRRQGGEEGHDHEGRARVPEVLPGQRQEALAGEDGERAADEDDVDDDVGGAAGEGEKGDHPEPARVAEQEDGDRRGERGQPVDGRVEDRAHERPPLDHLRDEHAEDRAEDGVLPAEEDLARHDEDERERDDALVLDVERDGLHVCEQREPEEENHPDACRDVGVIQRYSHHSPGGHR